LTSNEAPVNGDRPRLGNALALSGQSIVAGAPTRDIQGRENAGMLHLFARTTDGAWKETAHQTAEEPTDDGQFANVVAATRSTVFATVDSRRQGGAAIAVYERDGDALSRVQTIESTASSEGADFANFLGITDDGRLLVGSSSKPDGRNAGRVEIFRRASGRWTKAATIAPPEDVASADHPRFGYEAVVHGESLFVSADLMGVDGHAHRGTVIRYRRRDGGWDEVERLAPDDPRADMWFGHRLARVDDTLFLAAPHDGEHGGDAGAVYVFGPEDGGWRQRQKITDREERADAKFGHDVAAEGDRMVVGMLDQRDVAVYENSGDGWRHRRTITAEWAEPGHWFGFRLAVGGPLGVFTEPRRSDGGAIHVYGID